MSRARVVDERRPLRQQRAQAIRRVDRRAAALLVAYLAWVSFAAVLNFEIWRLNA